MPYYVYQIDRLRLLKKLGECERFKEAKAAVNEHRKILDPNTGVTVRMIFADNELAAEDILSQPPREDPAAGEEY